MKAKPTADPGDHVSTVAGKVTREEQAILARSHAEAASRVGEHVSAAAKAKAVAAHKKR